jgi:hypothetical protein
LNPVLASLIAAAAIAGKLALVAALAVCTVSLIAALRRGHREP